MPSAEIVLGLGSLGFRVSTVCSASEVRLSGMFRVFLGIWVQGFRV